MARAARSRSTPRPARGGRRCCGRRRSSARRPTSRSPARPRPSGSAAHGQRLARATTSVTRSPSRARTCSSSPHSGGGCAPGGGRRGVRLHRPEQLADEAPRRPADQPDPPAGRHTRTSSSAARWWCGANMTPTQESTTSKLAVGVRQRLGVALLPVIAGIGPAPRDQPAGLEQLRGQVGGHHLGAAGRGGDRGVPRCRRPRPARGRRA